MKKRWIIVTVLLAVVFLMTESMALAQGKETWPKAISIGVPSVGSSPYIVYSGLGEMMRKYLGVPGTAEAVGGSTAIVALLGRKKMQFGQVSTDSLYEAVRGVEAYKGKKTDLRQLTPGIAFTMHFFARADSGIKKPEDVRGKRLLCYSPTASIMTLLGGLTLESVGMTRKDVIAMPVVSQPDAARSLTDHTADAFIHTGSAVSPVSTYAEMANSIDVRLIPLTEAQQNYIVAHSKGVLSPSELPGGHYKGSPNPTRSIAFDVPLVCLPEMPEDFIYEVTKLIYGKERRNEFTSLHAAAKTFRVERLEQEPPLTPYHKGSIRLYKEIGVWTKKMEEYQARVLKELGLPE